MAGSKRRTENYFQFAVGMGIEGEGSDDPPRGSNFLTENRLIYSRSAMICIDREEDPWSHFFHEPAFLSSSLCYMT